MMDEDTCDEILREISWIDERPRPRTTIYYESYEGACRQTGRIKKEAREEEKRKERQRAARKADNHLIEYFVSLTRSNRLWKAVLTDQCASDRGLLILAERLKSGLGLPQDIEKNIGVSFDYFHCGAWKEKHLKLKLAAQLLWLEHPGASASLIVFEMLRDSGLSKLLDLPAPPSDEDLSIRFRPIEDVIQKVNPRGRRRPGRYNTAVPFPTEIVPIPEICCDVERGKISAHGLYIFVQTLFAILVKKRKNYADFIGHPLLAFYTGCNPLLERCAEVWVHEQNPS
jgi:hypothetical protein